MALWLQIPGKSAQISLQNDPRSGHDRALIGPRSSRDRATIVILILHWTPFDDRGDDSVMKEP